MDWLYTNACIQVEVEKHKDAYVVLSAKIAVFMSYVRKTSNWSRDHSVNLTGVYEDRQ